VVEEGLFKERREEVERGEKEEGRRKTH